MKNNDIPLSQRKVSFIGDPISDSVLYVGKKLESELCNLESAANCLVFVECGMVVPTHLAQQHQIVHTSNPTYDYAQYVQKIADEIKEKECELTYRLTSEGYYLGSNVGLGKNVHIEPGAFIGHGVTIGDNSTILTGAVIKDSVIGKKCLIKEYALIGTQGFMMASDTPGEHIRIPCLGSVILGDHVEVGSFTTVCRGSNTSTKLSDYVKIDDHVHVGHDVVVEKGALLTAASVLGGYDHIGEGAYIGLNATIKQMVTVESGSFVTMGARVAKDVKATDGNFGMPVKK